MRSIVKKYVWSVCDENNADSVNYTLIEKGAILTFLEFTEVISKEVAILKVHRV